MAINNAINSDQALGKTSAVQFNSVQFNTTSSLLDSNGNIVIALFPTATAVNYLMIDNAIIGTGPNIAVGGADTNASLGLQSKGSGPVGISTTNTTTPIVFSTGTAYQHVTNFNFANTAATRTVTFPDSSGTVAYVGGGTGVDSITGTANQVIASASTGAVSLSLPQSIAPTSTPTFGGLTLASPLIGTSGGTGVNNGANTLTLGGNLTTSGAFNSTFTMTGATSVTFPTSGTLATTSQIPSFPLSLTNGGTNANLTASNGGIFYSSATAGAILSGTATAQQLLMSGASTTPQWSTTTYPLTNAINTLLYASSANVISALATASSGVLITSAGGVPSISTTLPSGISATNMALTTPTLGVAAATSINFGGVAFSTYTGLLTWTPTFTFVTVGNLSVSYAAQLGFYTRIGNIVRANFTLTFTPTFTTASGIASIGGLPVASNSGTGNVSVGAMYCTGITTFPTSTLTVALTNSPGNTSLAPVGIGPAATSNNFMATNFTSGSAVTIYGTIEYLV